MQNFKLENLIITVLQTRVRNCSAGLGRGGGGAGAGAGAGAVTPLSP